MASCLHGKSLFARKAICDRPASMTLVPNRVKRLIYLIHFHQSATKIVGSAVVTQKSADGRRVSGDD
jgi:hypothetical protein